ncbi:MAG: flagellar hook-basal body complex protein FliE [Lysinibacillus sp.]|nr:flagellar hook-basal body complex protein FliE [Lysinibacillus sp.]
MAINPISITLPTQSVNEINKSPQLNTPIEAQQTFAETLKEAINTVNDYQVQSDHLTNKLINGDNVELYEVMIAAQKASITLNATVEVRNKVIEAYQEIMRMTV